MFRPRTLSALVAFVATLTLAVPRAAQADDLKAMEGTWRVKSAEAAGMPVESEDLKAIVVTIKGESYTVMTRQGPDAGTLKIDEKQSPRSMDATRTEGFEAGKVIKAIYKIDGDTMTVCYALDGGDRPTELATKEGAPWLLITYERAKE